MQRNGTLHCFFPELEVTTSQAPTRPPPCCTPPRRPPPPSSARPAPRRTHHTPCKRIFTCRCNKKIPCRNFFKTWAYPMQCAVLSRHCLPHVCIYGCYLFWETRLPHPQQQQWLPMQKISQKTFTNRNLYCQILLTCVEKKHSLPNPRNLIIAPILLSKTSDYCTYIVMVNI